MLRLPCVLSRAARNDTLTVCAALTLAVFLSVPAYAHHIKRGATIGLPVTTSSAKARELYEKGMADYENLYLERCNDDWRAAVKEDPGLALAWAWIAFNSSNPQEISAARAKAKEDLETVRLICGTDCRAYRMLKEMIDGTTTY